MSEERVDKAWQKHGLGKYSVNAILGTLRHYGVQVDEAGFKTLSTGRYPLQIAEDWHATWKGTGQFSRFHWMAADELWRRVQTGRLPPSDFAVGLVEMLKAVGRLLEGAAAAPVGLAFQKLDELKSRVPLQEGEPDPAFVGEVALRLGDAIKVINRLAPELARAGHIGEAQRFAEWEEFLFPQLAGVSRALVCAEKGEREPALEELVAIGRDASRDPASRVSALDGMIHLDAYAPATELARTLLDAAEQAEDFHLALDVGERLAWLLEQGNASVADQGALDERRKRIQQAHAAAHPGH